MVKIPKPLMLNVSLLQTSMSHPLREKCPNTEFLLIRIFPHSVRLQENMDQKKFRIWTLIMHWASQLGDLVFYCLDENKLLLACKESIHNPGMFHYEIWVSRYMPLRKKCPYSQLFWSAFSCIWIEYGDILFTQCAQWVN